MLLVPPVLLKMGSTIWRFGRYYTATRSTGAKDHRCPCSGLLGPVVVILTVVVFGTGIALLLGPYSIRSQMLQLHRISFILWFGAMAIHVLGHIVETARVAPRDWMRRTRSQVDGAGARQWALAVSLVLGVILAVIVVPQVGPWLDGGQHVVAGLQR